MINSGTPLPLERFYHWEKTHPNKVCFVQPIGGGQTVDYTWAEVCNQVRRIATYLKSIGVEKGTNVGIISQNSAHWIMSDLAIWLVGGVSVPLYSTSTAASVEQILKHSQCSVLFVGLVDHWDDIKQLLHEDIQCIALPVCSPNDFNRWNDIIASSVPFEESPSQLPSDLATIIYTSGTTGEAKGVMHSYGSLSAGAYRAAHIYELTAADRILSYLPLSHVAERMCVELVSIYQGVNVFFVESQSTFVSDLRRAKPTLFFAVPRIWAKFQENVHAKFPEKLLQTLLRVPVVASILRKKIRAELGLTDARLCLSGAAAIPGSLMLWFKTLGIEILETYGMTENMGYSHCTRVDRSCLGYVGQPNPGVDAVLSEKGEVWVRSPSNMLGYYQDPEATADTLDVDGFIHTGDVGKIESDGSLKITGRIKDIFKTSKGKYVAPLPIENILLASTDIEQVCIMGAGLPQPLALVVLSSVRDEASQCNYSTEIDRDLALMLKDVNKDLDPHQKIKSLIVVKAKWSIDNDFLTPTLKIKRHELEAHYRSQLNDWYNSGVDVLWEQ